MTIRHLRTFVIVFQKESITKASEILHVSQPSVSLAIQELENYYHIRLFDRIGKRLSITEQGKWLYDYALHIVSMFDEMETEVKTWNNKGTLRIGSSITIGNFILPQLIEEFQKRYREVEIKVSVCNTKTIEQYILNNEVDLALIEGKTEYEQIQMEHLMEDPLCLICAANSELVKQEKISLIDLERYPMILTGERCAGNDRGKLGISSDSSQSDLGECQYAGNYSSCGKKIGDVHFAISFGKG